MGEVSTIGLDIAKSVFQVHGVAVDGALNMVNVEQTRTEVEALRVMAV
jgi:hypothetical protein